MFSTIIYYTTVPPVRNLDIPSTNPLEMRIRKKGYQREHSTDFALPICHRLNNKHHTAHTTIACIQESLNSHDGHYHTQSSQELKLIKQTDQV